MIKLSDLKVTDSERFDFPAREENEADTFSLNVILNDSIMIQRGTDGEWSIPQSCLAYWGDGNEEIQDYAHDNFCADDVAETLWISDAEDEISQ